MTSAPAANATAQPSSSASMVRRRRAPQVRIRPASAKPTISDAAIRRFTAHCARGQPSTPRMNEAAKRGMSLLFATVLGGGEGAAPTTGAWGRSMERTALPPAISTPRSTTPVV